MPSSYPLCKMMSCREVYVHLGNRWLWRAIHRPHFWQFLCSFGRLRWALSRAAWYMARQGCLADVESDIACEAGL